MAPTHGRLEPEADAPEGPASGSGCPLLAGVHRTGCLPSCSCPARGGGAGGMGHHRPSCERLHSFIHEPWCVVRWRRRQRGRWSADSAQCQVEVMVPPSARAVKIRLQGVTVGLRRHVSWSGDAPNDGEQGDMITVGGTMLACGAHNELEVFHPLAVAFPCCAQGGPNETRVLREAQKAKCSGRTHWGFGAGCVVLLSLLPFISAAHEAERPLVRCGEVECGAQGLWQVGGDWV